MESQLIQYGVLGVVLAWLMWRVETRLDSIREQTRLSSSDVTKSIDRLTRTQLLALVDRPGGDALVKEQARQILADMPPVHLETVGVPA